MTVYILKCSDGTYYTGVTNDLIRRLTEHQMGYDPFCYTANRRSVELMYSCEFTAPNEAIAAEKRMKKWSKKKKEALFREDWDEIKRLSKKKRNKPSRIISDS